ncbi:MAG TPA: hypothetical protein VER08_03320 [Pyrinomonadaceae bacterium]|nr:hypothetical protein [Pyrinomonadaceae bacterium]
MTKATVWLALLGYAAGASALLLARGREEPAARGRLRKFARGAWTFGCAWFLAHVASAFNFQHGWSHAHAYAETARQTGEVVGVSFGAGVFVSYVFTLLWAADTLWWWLAPDSHERRPRFLDVVWHALFFFIVFNGTVVFERGPARWLGLLITAALVAAWWAGRERVRLR